MKRLIRSVLVILLSLCTACGSTEPVTKRNAIKTEEKNDYDEGTKTVKFDGFSINVPKKWTDKNPYFYIDGDDEETEHVSMLYVMINPNSETVTRDDLTKGADSLFDGFKSKLNEDCIQGEIKKEIRQSNYLVSCTYENVIIDDITANEKVYFFEAGGKLAGLMYVQPLETEFDHFSDFERIIDSIKCEPKEEQQSGKKISTDFIDSADKLVTYHFEGFVFSIPKNWRKTGDKFSSSSSDSAASVRFNSFEVDGLTDDWLSTASSILFDGGNGYAADSSKVVMTNSIRMHVITAVPVEDADTDGSDLLVYIFRKPETEKVIMVTFNEPTASVNDYSDDFRRIIGSTKIDQTAEAEKPKTTDEPVVHEEPAANENEEKTRIIEDTEIDDNSELIDSLIPLTKYTVSMQTTYSHSSDIVILGNNENLTITIEASPAGLTDEDFIYDYDDTMLSLSVEKVRDDTSRDKSYIELSVSAKKPGYSEMGIYSIYELLTVPEEDLTYYPVYIQGLDSRAGKIVYVTPTGEKYHLSEAHAGENAIATTLYDVESWGMEPCSVCGQ